MDVPLEILDRELPRAHAALGAAVDALHAERRDPADVSAAVDDEEIANPLARHRRVSSKATFVDLRDAVGPLAEPVRRWVHALTLERVLWPDTVRFARAYRRPTIQVSETATRTFTTSPRDLVLLLLREGSEERRRILADALARGAAPTQDAATILAERRLEAARLLGASNEALENPVDPAAALDATARRFLTETAAFADLDGSTSWAATLALASGRDAALGWPARLRARWLFDLFGAGPLTEGLRPSQGPLPAAVGATSFARALGAFGAALADADGPTATPARPWSTTRAPFDARPHRRAALFASLAADPVFAISALGLGRGKARDQARVVARALLIGARLDAVRVLCRGALGAPASERADRFEEATAAALGAPIPGSLAGVIPRIGPDAPARFVGTVLGIHDRRGLIDRFDEDWFRSPHAARAIREEDASSPAFPSAIPAAALDAALAEITRTIGELA